MMKTFDEIWAEYCDVIKYIRSKFKPTSETRYDLIWEANIALRNEISKYVKPKLYDMNDKASNLLYRINNPEYLV